MDVVAWYNLRQFQDDTSSVISFTSSIHSLNDASMATHRRNAAAEAVDEKVDSGISLLELFGSNDVDKLSKTFLAMSSSPANCDNVSYFLVIWTSNRYFIAPIDD